MIQRFLDVRLLYKDALYHNCVFVGRDGSSQPKFASKRGTRDLSGSSFKRDVLGSDKKVGFRLPCDPEIEEVAVFEAPTDLMSFCTLCLKVHSNTVALCGLYSGPLDTYLRDHPHLKAIKLLLDHDEPGIMAAKKQWATEYLPLYPSANILVAAKKDFETKNQKRFCGRIATGDYGAIIIEHSQFENIPVSIERQRYLLEQHRRDVLDGIVELKANHGEQFSIKQMERTRKSIDTKLADLNNQSRKDDIVTFEQLGVDMMFVDESDNYKNRAKRCATSRC